MKNSFSIVLATIVFLGTLAAALPAAEVKIFRGDNRETTLTGTLDALSVDPLGALALARRVERLAGMEEPFVFTAAGHPDGWVVGTGNSGKVLLIDSAGQVSELFATAKGEIFAVEASQKGVVYAAGSPYGSVYRFQDGEAEAIFEPDAAYVWDLALDSQGRLLVGTGFPGRLYRLDGDRSEMIFESSDLHIRAIQPLADGSILVGTAGQGLVLRVFADGTVRTLHDGVAPEVLAFAMGGEGVAYAAIVASEASLVDLSASQAPARSDGEEDEDEVSVVTQAATTIGSRSSTSSGPRSTILRIDLTSNHVEEVQSFTDETVHSLLYHEDELWIGTGEEGRIYRLQDDRLTLERDLAERQVTALVLGGQGVAAVCTNAAALYLVPGGVVSAGTYTSQVRDAGQVSRFGSFTFAGDLPPGSAVAVAVRSGMSAEPDATWTAWQSLTTKGEGREVALAEVPAGRYVEWRATLSAGKNGGPRITMTELSYQQENVRPKIASFEALDPGEILVPASFNPQNQVYEPWSPNREGIFTSLKPEKKTNGDSSRLKTLWKKGYRSLKWEASDANEDELLYSLAFRRDGDDGDWLTMVEDLDDAYYSFDATVLPDGVYHFRLRASDRTTGDVDAALVAEEVSVPVTIDHTSPRLVRTSRHDGVVEVELADGLNPLRDVKVSADAGPWTSLAAADGLLDGRRERVHVEANADTRLLLLRVTDAAWNVVTFDLLAEKP